MDFESLVRAKNELEPRVAQLYNHLDPERKLLELEQIEEQTAQKCKMKQKQAVGQ